MARFHSRGGERAGDARRANYERQHEEYIARRSYEDYQEVSRKAERETRELLSPIESFVTGQLEDPGDIQRLNDALARATAHLRSRDRIKAVLERGVSADAMRNTPLMLVEFNSMIEGYRSRLDTFRTRLPRMIEGLREEGDRKGLTGIALLKINTKIQELEHIAPALEKKIEDAVTERNRLLSEYSEAVQEAAIFRIKLGYLLDSLDRALKEGRSEAIIIGKCCVQMAINLHKEPFEFVVDEEKQTYDLIECEPEPEVERNRYDGVRRIREAQRRIRILDRVMPAKPEAEGEGDEAVYL